MTLPLVISTPAGVRRLAAADLPVRIGTGGAADIRIPGPATGEVIGLVSCLDDRPFIQATSAESAALAVNGEAIAATRWLQDGDVITAGTLRIECHFDAAALGLSVAYTDSEYATLPPVGGDAGAKGAAISPVRARPVPTAPGRRRRLSWFLYGALALLAAAVLDLFTSRAVHLDIAPAEARVSLRGAWIPIKVGGRYLLRPGAYQVSLAAEGYEPMTQDISVGDPPSQDIALRMSKLPGRIAVVPTPEVPVRVFIDDKEVTPAEGGRFRVAAGPHSFRVQADRYLPFETKIEVEGREVLQDVAASLLPNWADVAVATQPPGAAIKVGEESLGITPATIPVIAGTAQLELRLDGFKPWRQAITVTAGQRVELPQITLQEVDGLLNVVTTPAGAAVTIDGRYRGATPVDVEITSGRMHEVIVTKPGFETIGKSIRVERRGTATLRLAMAQRVGVVRIDSDPPDAELLVNGAPRGAASQELSLAAVAQHIEVRKAGFAPFITDVTPRPGLPQVIRVRLLTPEQAVLEATPKTVSTKQGLVMRLVEAGHFEMGAPRREQGHRPNESQRPVRITRRFYIGTREITNREFREFKPNHTSGAEKYQDLAGAEHPAVMLSWEDAASFCNWLSDREGLQAAYVMKEGVLRLAEPRTGGYRLPTEAEWEWAGRYNGGGGARRYPWGDQMPPTEHSGNFADQSAQGIVPNVLSSYDDGYPVTAPVASFQPSPLGLYDIGGNAAEWVNDLYTVYSSGAEAEAVDPVGPASGQYHVIRGSSWRHASISELRLAYRDFGDQGRLDVGFRIARDAD